MTYSAPDNNKFVDSIVTDTRYVPVGGLPSVRRRRQFPNGKRATTYEIEINIDKYTSSNEKNKAIAIIDTLIRNNPELVKELASELFELAPEEFSICVVKEIRKIGK